MGSRKKEQRAGFSEGAQLREVFPAPFEPQRLSSVNDVYDAVLHSSPPLRLAYLLAVWPSQEVSHCKGEPTAVRHANLSLFLLAYQPALPPPFLAAPHLHPS